MTSVGTTNFNREQIGKRRSIKRAPDPQAQKIVNRTVVTRRLKRVKVTLPKLKCLEDE